MAYDDHQQTSLEDLVNIVNEFLESEDVNFKCGLFIYEEGRERNPAYAEMHNLIFLHNSYKFEKKNPCRLAEIYLATCITHFRLIHDVKFDHKELFKMHEVMMIRFSQMIKKDEKKGGLDEELQMKELHNLFKVVLRCMHFGLQKDLQGSTLVPFFSDKRFIFISLVLHLLFGQDCVQNALVTLLEQQKVLNKRCEPNCTVSFLIHHCSASKVAKPPNWNCVHADLNKEYVVSIQKDGMAQFISRMFLKFISSKDPEIHTFRQFLLDIPKLKINFGNVPDDEVMPTYSLCVFNYISERVKRKPDFASLTAENSSEKNELLRFLLPVLLKKGLPLEEITEILTNSSKPAQFLKYLQDQYGSGTTEQKKKIQKVRDSIKKKIQKVRDSIKKSVGPLKNTVFPESTVQILEELKTFKFHKHHLSIHSVIQCAEDLATTAILMAEHSLHMLEPKDTEKTEICVITNSAKNFQETSLKIDILPFSDNTTTPSNRSVRYGTLQQAEGYLNAQKVITDQARKKMPRRFLILAGTTNVRSNIRTKMNVVSLSPLLLLTWIHAKLYFDFDPPKTKDIAKSKEKILNSVKTFLVDDLNYRFDHAQVAEHVDIAFSILMEEKIFMFDTQSNELAKLKDSIVSLLKEYNGKEGRWIQLKDMSDELPKEVKTTTRVKTEDVKDRYHFCVFPAIKDRILELSPIFLKNKTEWKNAMKYEIEIQKEKAVIVTTTEDSYGEIKKFLGTRLKSLTPTTPSPILMKKGDVLLLSIDDAFQVTCDPTTFFHVISCDLPRDDREYGQLLGKHMIPNTAYTQRFVLREDTLLVDTKIIFGKNIPEDWNSQEDPPEKEDTPKSDNAKKIKELLSSGHISGFLRKRNQHEHECWKLYEATENILETLE